MNYLSVCSGIEAATVAWHDFGWKPVGFSEIEKFPSQVLEHHYPTVTNFGDMTKYKEWNINDPIGLLVGGTPCQSFSVAGLRKGLEDPRGNLALTYLGILDRFRPKWCVWENVQGVLSSGGGRDFGAFLGAMGELGYGFAYRVLDAQNFGVAQRRRRVFVVGHLGDWKPAAEVLFESESLRGDIKKGRNQRKEAPRTSASSIVYENHAQDSRVKEVEVSPTVAAKWGTGGGNIPFVQKAYNIRECDSNNTFNAIETNTATTLQKTQPSVQSHHTQTFVTELSAVRRLTPVECERLQGFPDNYTNIKENCPDGNRYKALGNSMAVPVMRWIGQRIKDYEQK
jgi:DNA (cytosine-5)-methyltransferase 1